MNTIVQDPVFGDPRFFQLARVIGDPLRAMGALVFLWHGTQNRKLVTVTMDELLDCFPPGYRGAKSAISALIRSGWLQTTGETIRVVGNDEHVLKKEEISQKNRDAANARCNALRMHQASQAHHETDAPGINPACARDATLRSDPIRTDAIGGGDPPPAPVSDSLLEVHAGTIAADRAHRLLDTYHGEMTVKRGHAPVLVPTPLRVQHARMLLALAGGNDELAAKVVLAYVRSDHEWWKKKRWALHVLTDPKDFEHAMQLAASEKAATKPRMTNAELDECERAERWESMSPTERAKELRASAANMRKLDPHSRMAAELEAKADEEQSRKP